MLRAALVLAAGISFGLSHTEPAAGTDELRNTGEPSCRLKPHARRNLREIEEILGRIESRPWGDRPSVVLVTLEAIVPRSFSSRSTPSGPIGWAPTGTLAPARRP
jgi:hypothetical protein